MSSITRIEDNCEIVTEFHLAFDYTGEKDWGFSFPCDQNGVVDELTNPAAIQNYQDCLSGKLDVVNKGVKTYTQRHRLCNCGSGEYPEDIHDGHGIFLARVCDKCRKERLKGYRSDIFEDYECDEPIDVE